MNKFLIFASVLVILSLALSACGTAISGGIQLPGGDQGGESTASDNTLIYVLLTAIVLVVVVALVAQR